MGPDALRKTANPRVLRVRTISIINQKGGCGKTTSAINLAGVFARRGLRTLLVDLDPQAHCAAGLAIPEQRIDMDIGDAMLADPGRPIDHARLLWRVSRNLDLAPSRMRLAGLEAPRGGLADAPDKERRLRGVLSHLARDYDACLVDCSPSIGLLTYNALTAADEVLVPVETSFFALQGATKQVNTIRSMGKRLGAPAPFWLVATIHDEASVLARDLLDELHRRFGRRVAPAVIRRDLTLKEAASFGQPIIEYAPGSMGSKDYSALADWLIGVAALAPGSSPASRTIATGDLGGPLAEPKFAPGEPVVTVVELDPGVPLPVVLADEPPQPSESLPSAPTPVPLEPAPGLPEIVTCRPEPAPSVEPSAPSGSVPAAAPAPLLSRAQDIAQRARLMQLRRADERLRQVAALERRATILALAPPAEPPVPPAHPRPIERVEHLLGARTTRRGVLFVQPLSIGTTVAVAGSFNAWSPAEHPMRRNESAGVFELLTPLPPGRHRYRLVIDGRWTVDPFNAVSEPSPFGELNSVVEVPGETGIEAGAPDRDESRTGAPPQARSLAIAAAEAGARGVMDDTGKTPQSIRE